MRFGGPVQKPYRDPGKWLALVREMEYSAVYFPLNHTAPRDQIMEHMNRHDEVVQAAGYIRQVAAGLGIRI